MWIDQTRLKSHFWGGREVEIGARDRSRLGPKSVARSARESTNAQVGALLSRADRSQVRKWLGRQLGIEIHACDARGWGEEWAVNRVNTDISGSQAPAAATHTWATGGANYYESYYGISETQNP